MRKIGFYPAFRRQMLVKMEDSQGSTLYFPTYAVEITRKLTSITLLKKDAGSLLEHLIISGKYDLYGLG